jgi:hypothetical protein
MKQYLLTGVFLLFSAAFSYAEPGSRFCIYATVVTTADNKVYKGYFDIGGFDLALLKDSIHQSNGFQSRRKKASGQACG